MKTTNGNRQITTEDALRMMQNMNQSSGGQTNPLDAYPVGSVYITSANSNPAEHFGGTWQLFDKHLKRNYYSSADVPEIVKSVSGYCDSYTVVAITDIHKVTLIMSYTMNADFIETNANVLTLDFPQMGFSRLSTTPYFFGSGDSVEGIVYLSMGYTTGTIKQYDVVSKTDGGSMVKGSRVYLQAELPTSWEYFDDAFCDKFFWKRTA